MSQPVTKYIEQSSSTMIDSEIDPIDMLCEMMSRMCISDNAYHTSDTYDSYDSMVSYYYPVESEKIFCQP
jgi:hypothetical protein